MSREQVLNSIKENKDLPTLGAFYSKFRQKMKDSRTSATEIADLISSDQVIASRVLRTANSPFYGLVSRVTTIPHAIVVIGFNGIHYIILNTAIMSMFAKAAADSLEVFDVSKLWQHSCGTAIISRLIAKRVNYSAFEEMFTAGLLHDIGKLYIYKYYPADFEKIMHEISKGDICIREAEDKIMGVNHAEIGEVLLREWNIPEGLIAIAAFHHNPVLAKTRAKSAALVHVADLFCRAMEVGSGGDNLIPVLSREAWDKTGLEVDDLDDIVKAMDKELRHFDVFGALSQ
jgi:putative nucleotidyltransferase with HDIG domain